MPPQLLQGLSLAILQIRTLLESLHCLGDIFLFQAESVSDISQNFIQRDSKRLTKFRTSVFPELYMVCE